MGQNFLIDPTTAESIIRRACLTNSDVVLEIGAGLGALTIPLARTAGRVYAVEKDRQLIHLLKTELLTNQISNCEVIAVDVLDLDLHALAAKEAKEITVIGNLPYGISSQILIKLIGSRNVLKRAVLMFQKELAQRLVAQPGNRKYGRITAMLRYCASIRILANVKSSVFYPPPEVDSTVIEIGFISTAAYGAHDEAMLFKVIKAAFGNRRKTLKNALLAGALGVGSRKIAKTLTLAGIEPSRRAETLEPSEFVSLTNCLKAAMANSDSC
jgi:16S rRNA (adenine1518-N6/adenine1519-N6)-dimethyltransferase